jgi:hypothetical protein
MKKVLLIIGLVLISQTAQAADYVNGYVKKNGTYVAPHFKTSADSYKFNNYSTQGNVNPYTGSKGYVNPYAYKPTNYAPAYKKPKSSYGGY